MLGFCCCGAVSGYRDLRIISNIQASYKFTDVTGVLDPSIIPTDNVNGYAYMFASKYPKLDIASVDDWNCGALISISNFEDGNFVVLSFSDLRIEFAPATFFESGIYDWEMYALKPLTIGSANYPSDMIAGPIQWAFTVPGSIGNRRSMNNLQSPNISTLAAAITADPGYDGTVTIYIRPKTQSQHPSGTRSIFGADKGITSALGR